MWNQDFKKKILACTEIEYSPDISVKLMRKGGLITSEKEVGHFTVPLKSIKGITEESRPMFFNFLDSTGIKGRCLCLFYLQAIESYGEQEDEKMLYNDLIQYLCKVQEIATIRIGMIGIRNLASAVKKLEIKAELIDCEDWGVPIKKRQKQKPEVDIEEGVEDPKSKEIPEVWESKTKNPNILQLIEFKNVKFTKEPLLWPYIKFTFIDKGIFSESYSMTIPLFKFT